MRRGSVLWASLCVALATSAVRAQSPVVFSRTLPDISVGTTPYAVVIADLNADTKADLAVANLDSSDVSVLWGNNDGMFVDSGATFQVGTSPVAIAVGDFNDDQKPDLVVADEVGNTVNVLLNQGGMVFGAPIATDTGSSPEAVVVGDFNEDGKLDVATSDNFDDTVTVLLGAGNGTFTAHTISGTCGNAANAGSACAGDADCDGTAGSCVLVGAAPVGLLAVDVDGDGHLDLVVTNSDGGSEASGTLSILKGLGNGTFVVQPEITSTAFNVPVAVASGFFNDDTTLDLAVINEEGDNVSVLLGTGNLGFGNAISFSVASFPEGLAVADFNGDGKQDIATSSNFEDKVSVLLGGGDGSFMPAQDFNVGAAPFGIAAGNLNDDSKADLVTTNQDDGTVSVLINATPAACAGDCDGNGSVDVTEIIKMVNIALGTAPVTDCEAGDTGGDGTIDVTEIITAVNHALTTCEA